MTTKTHPLFPALPNCSEFPFVKRSFACPAVTGLVTVFKLTNYKSMKREINYTLMDKNKLEKQLLKLSAEV